MEQNKTDKYLHCFLNKKELQMLRTLYKLQ